MKKMARNLAFAAAFPLLIAAGRLAADETATPAIETPAQHGYRLLTTKAYLPPDFDQEVFDRLWETWEEPLRSQAERATREERRQMAFSRYGLTEDPARPGGTALQYTDDGQGGWVMNCLACHSGKVAGRTVPGVPNSLYALQTLTEEVRQLKLALDKPLARMDLGSLVMPLGTTNGTTNAVMFGVALMNFRDAELNVHRDRPRPKMLHHDHDAPPWWNVRKKQRLYADDFAVKSHRTLMQFLLIPQNGPEKFHEWEADYRDILAYIESLEPPPYPFALDRALASRGQAAFQRVCAECHGTYGNQGSYPERVVPIDLVGTDRARLDSLSAEGRLSYGTSWFTWYGRDAAIAEPGGYVAPPLDGIWASAPYLHNGSVPTLWHLLYPDERPTIWLRTEDGYDTQRVGLEVTPFDRFPASADSHKERRRYFDTRPFGKSAAGHTFPNQLSAEERQAVLEYLKTL